ncbi:MAG: hypothetical protein P4L42_00685 [Desulfocapsaceae bacterium]|nr:hypothetical protein [Desulfocapsaceae bacterium]
MPILVILVAVLLFAIGTHRNILHLFDQQGGRENTAEPSKPGDQIISSPGVSTPIASDKGQQAPPSEVAQPSPPSSGDVQQAAPPGATTPTQAIDRINAFYAHLDAQPYIQAFHLGKPSKMYSLELMQKLLDNPPVVLRETDNMATIVKNTAHFFRAVGKDNITIIKAVFDQEKPSLEDVFADFFSLSESPDSLQKGFSLRIPPNSLYEYAGFFLNTIGGRLYLFRRDPAVRLTVTYYSILAIDRANQESNNRNGIQINQAIDALITEMENSGSQLRYKDRYLDRLYELKQKYQ